MPIGEVAGLILRGARGGGDRNVDTSVVVRRGKEKLERKKKLKKDS